MGLIMKNGISYGGGSGGGTSADCSVDITEEEYNNLLASGQVDKNITYYITDGELDGEDSFSGIIEVTQQEYDALSDEEKNNGAIYAITDSEDLAAKNMAYDGSVTGLGNNVQDAIDNVNNKIDEQNKTTTITLTSPFATEFVAIKSGNNVMLVLDYLHDLIANSSNIIGILPNELIPAHKVSQDFISADLSEFYRFTISRDGSLRCYPYQSVNKQSGLVINLQYIL